jgi:predicted ATPase/DNA-binding SARP family transcriptional activator
MSNLRLSLLGPPRLERDGVPLKFDTRKIIALVAYLAMTNRSGSHSREALITLLWPELEPSRARAILRRNLSVLKKALGGEWLVVDREIIGTDPDAGLWLDVDQFRNLLLMCQGHGHPGADVCPECLTSLAEAVELYQGDFAAGFSLRDSPNFDEWQFFQTESLRRELASALERLVRGHAAQGTHRAAIPYARRWLALDPLHEPVHRHLMGLYAWSGQRTAALRQYSECERILEDELGVPPEEETSRLYRAIKAERDLPRAAMPLSSQATPRKHNLPVQPTPFVGREVELSELGKLLTNPDVRLVTILGAGGMGKTRLSVEAATAYIDHFAHGVYLVPLAPLQSIEAIVPTVAEALGFSFRGEGKPEQQLLAYLRRKTLLLIMDSFEHLLPSSIHPPRGTEKGGVSLVTDILRTAADVRILATSQARLNVQGEHLFPITGVDFPDWETCEDAALRQVPPGPSPRAAHPNWDVSPRGLRDKQDAAQYSAVRLFLNSARRAQPGFELTADNLSDVVRICRLVEGMPLAILLAAAWVDILTPEEIAEEIGQGLDFLKTDLRDVPARQRSVRAVFDHSWHLLSEREREVFQALSVFRGGFTRRAARQVIDGSLRELRSLVNKSLLHRLSTGRYEMHELLRRYAAERLDGSPTAGAAARNRHAAYYAAALHQQAPDLKGPRAQAALAEIETESENARVAWTWAAELGQVGRLEQVMEGLCFFYLWRRRSQEGAAMCRLAAEKLAAAVSEDGLRVWAKILMWQGTFSRQLGRTEAAGQLLQESLGLLKRPELSNRDTRPEQASVLLQMGHIAFDSDRREARQLYAASQALYRALGDRWGTANALSGLGWTAWSGSAYPEAQQLFEESLAIRKALGDQRGIIDSLTGLSFIAWFQGQFEEAERLMRHSVVVLQEMVLQAGSSSGLPSLEGTLPALNEYAEVHTPYQESLAFYSDLAFGHGLAPTNSTLGFVKKHLGQYESARAQGQVGLALAREAGWRQEVALNLQVLGEVALAEGAYAEAQDRLRESVAILRETRQLELSDALAVLAYTARGLGQLPQAEQHLAEALRTASEIQAIFPHTTALAAIALLLADQGEKERAVELYALASRYPRVANSRWFDDIAGRHISVVAATLRPDVVAAARARGRARDLKATTAELLAELVG